ncbi:MAG: hypothetical protein BIFFINMI_00784 [Phycisphaerae bacterium]|nr:hypothetical protein [Phycisphaerae bacterium]
MRRLSILGFGLLILANAAAGADEAPGPFRPLSQDTGGHPFSQVIYAPTINALVSWGTRVHGIRMTAAETMHFPVEQGKWIDALPAAVADKWAGQYKEWGDWEICSPTASFYERDGIRLPRPNSSFYQCCWDQANQRVLFYVGSMTFSYDPAKCEWKLIHDVGDKAQPPALLLWGAMCYDPVGRQAILFGGGGVDAPDGRPHTWALDCTNDTWKKLDLKVEPPPRCNSRLVYDSRDKLMVLFGGDGQDRGLADTWVFDPARHEWQQRQPKVSPPPRSCHAMTYLPKSGLVLLIGGRVWADWQKAQKLANQVWVYDVSADAWSPVNATAPRADWLSAEALPGSDEAILVACDLNRHNRRTWRFAYDPAMRVAADSPEAAKFGGVPQGTFGLKADRTVAWYSQAPAPEPEKTAAELAKLPANQWVDLKPPRTTNGRTWGTAIFDGDRGVAMKWGGGHSGYQGTDMAFYDVATNRWNIDRDAAYTPDPFGQWARRPAGRTFFNQPWARHMRHTCAYDRVRHVGVFTDAGGSDWFDRDAGKVIKWTWIYDPVKRAWLDRLVPQPFPGGGSVSPIAIDTPTGVVVYQHDARDTWGNSGRLYRFTGEAGKPETFGWDEIKIANSDRPFQREHMTMVYDSKRDRLIFLSGDSKSGKPELWFFGFADGKWVRNPSPADGGVVSREAVYVPDADAVLAYGPTDKDDEHWTHVYHCAENRWVTPDIKTPHSQAVHECALLYDPVHKLSLLLWPQQFEGPIAPLAFRLDAAALAK